MARTFDELASAYHLIFEDWNASIRKQGEVLAELLPAAGAAGSVLDCACGIGTHVLALAALGYAVEGSDPSEPAVRRARLEAEARGFAVDFRVDDMRKLATAPRRRYGVILALDNAVPHLESDEEILGALSAMRERLRTGGTLLLSLRDYGNLMAERPAGTPPLFFRDGGYRRIVHQVWDWRDERRYTVHLYITRETAHGWKNHHFVGSDTLSGELFTSVALRPEAGIGGAECCGRGWRWPIPWTARNWRRATGRRATRSSAAGGR